MSGILDKKSRIIDAILTIDGRRQLAEKGGLNVSYVTFTDLGVSYIYDKDEGHQDPTDRIYFEACNLPQDQITFEATDEGKIQPFRYQDVKLSVPYGSNPSYQSDGSIVNGRLVAYQYNHGRSIKTSTISENTADNNKGFYYSDVSGVTGSILVTSDFDAGVIEMPSGPPYKCYIGTKGGGLGPQQFAKAISGSIETIRTYGGPDVYCSVNGDTVYLDVFQSFQGFGTVIEKIGELSSPLEIMSDVIGGNLLSSEVEDAYFSSQVQGILTSSFDNFQKIQSIGSFNRLLEGDEFRLSTNELTFDISSISSKTFRALSDSPPSLNVVDSLFNDDKMSHLDNFLYLPPIIKTSDTLVPDKSNIAELKKRDRLLGDYPSWGDNEKKLSFSKLTQQLSDYKNVSSDVVFVDSSINNRVIGQFFEVSNNTVSKLDIVDFGVVMNDAQESTAITNRVFFVGKTFLDERGTTCFINMFTIIFSKDLTRINNQ